MQILTKTGQTGLVIPLFCTGALGRHWWVFLWLLAIWGCLDLWPVQGAMTEYLTTRIDELLVFCWLTEAAHFPPVKEGYGLFLGRRGSYTLSVIAWPHTVSVTGDCCTAVARVMGHILVRQADGPGKTFVEPSALNHCWKLRLGLRGGTGKMHACRIFSVCAGNCREGLAKTKSDTLPVVSLQVQGITGDWCDDSACLNVVATSCTDADCVCVCVCPPGK